MLFRSEQKQHLLHASINTAMTLEGKTHPDEVRRLMMDIIAADNDPRKTYNADAINRSFASGKLNAHERDYLVKQVADLRDPQNNSFVKQVNAANEQVARMFSQNPIAQAFPERAMDASNKFRFDLEQAIEKKRQAQEDPRVLLDPTSREYFLKPERVKHYSDLLLHGPTVMAEQAGKAVAQQKGALPTYKDYDKLKKGESFTDPQGNVRVKR